MDGIGNLEENFLVIEESIRGEMINPWYAFVLSETYHILLSSICLYPQL